MARSGQISGFRVLGCSLVVLRVFHCFVLSVNRFRLMLRIQVTSLGFKDAVLTGEGSADSGVIIELASFTHWSKTQLFNCWG